jgi:hypothetical protein
MQEGTIGRVEIEVRQGTTAPQARHPTAGKSMVGEAMYELQAAAEVCQ